MEQVTQNEAIRRLTSAVIINAVRNLGSQGNHSAVLEFLNSEWFEDIARLAGLDEREMSALRRKARTGNLDRRIIRAVYH